MSKFLLGLAIGVASGILFAPAEGEQTRERLAAKLQDWKELPRKKAVQFANANKEKAGQAAAEIARKATESAIDAAKEDLLGEEKTA